MPRVMTHRATIGKNIGQQIRLNLESLPDDLRFLAVTEGALMLEANREQKVYQAAYAGPPGWEPGPMVNFPPGARMWISPWVYTLNKRPIEESRYKELLALLSPAA